MQVGDNKKNNKKKTLSCFICREFSLAKMTSRVCGGGGGGGFGGGVISKYLEASSYGLEEFDLTITNQ